MAKSPRVSLLHAGIAPVYYVYKMLLSLWAASAQPRRRHPAVHPAEEIHDS